MSAGRQKKLMYLNRRAPYGTIYAVEGLEVVLIGAAFDQDVCMAFVGDGVYQLKTGQDTSGSDMKNFSPAYRALGDYDVTRLYVERESLEERGLTFALTPAAREALVKEGYDPAFGARPLRRIIQRRVENPLSKELLRGGYEPGDCITVDYGAPDDEGGGYRFSRQPGAFDAAGSETAAPTGAPREAAPVGA